FLPSSLEQLRVDGEADFERIAEHLLGGRGDSPGEGLLQPLLEVPIGHSHTQMIFLPNEAGVAFEPEFIAWLTDPAGNCPPQRRAHVAPDGSQGPLRLAASRPSGVAAMPDRKQVHDGRETAADSTRGDMRILPCPRPPGNRPRPANQPAPRTPDPDISTTGRTLATTQPGRRHGFPGRKSPPARTVAGPGCCVHRPTAAPAGPRPAAPRPAPGRAAPVPAPGRGPAGPTPCRPPRGRPTREPAGSAPHPPGRRPSGPATSGSRRTPPAPGAPRSLPRRSGTRSFPDNRRFLHRS